MDFAHHVLEHLEVSNNDYDGLGVMYSDIYFPDRVNTIKNSKFNANKRHGISFRQVCTLTQLQSATFFLTSYTFIYYWINQLSRRGSFFLPFLPQAKPCV